MTVHGPPLAVFVRELLARQPVGSATSSSNEVCPDLPIVVDERARIRSIEALRSETTVGGVNDPRNDAAVEPWLSLIETLLVIEPTLALSAGRTWYAALIDAAFDTDDPIHHRALAAYVVGVVEARVGNDVRADHWLEVGRTEAEFDDDQLKPFLDACNFVKGAAARR